MMLRRLIKSALNGLGLYSVLSRIMFRYRILPRYEEPEALRRQRRDFYRQLIRPGMLCFDVGANIGNRTAIFLALGARVIAIEPQPKCADFLQKRFGSAITLLRKGLGAELGRAEMYIPESSTIASISESWIESVRQSRFENYHWNESLSIELSTLDLLISQYGLPDFCKIDVEGYEFPVLQGLSQPIPCLSFEYTLPEQSHELRSCLLRLQSLSPEYQCNYSIAETMAFALPQWIPISDMLQLISTSAFAGTGGGDIYLSLGSSVKHKV